MNEISVPGAVRSLPTDVPPEGRPGGENPPRRTILPWLGMAGLVVLMVAQLRLMGRMWWCACAEVRPLWLGAWDAHTSQHFLDPYSFTHLLHGFAFCGLLMLVLPRQAWQMRLLGAVALEGLWEIVENSAFVIARYRSVTASLGYTGDTVLNSLGDVASCGAGFLLAQALGFRRALAIFLVVEVALLFWIRDCLTLNLVMLAWPIEGLRAWQLGR